MSSVRETFFVSCGHDLDQIKLLESLSPHAQAAFLGDTIVVKLKPKTPDDMNRIVDYFGQDKIIAADVIADGYSLAYVLAA
ncbi:MAG: hypothetical protein ACK4VI_01005 [Alphaproteobacteria bacterium]